ncbi:1-aminocyclopropane-1-carboxylate deaminase/D-cysteine desulfhydrase [Hugenholtzia roseola]|uniref:1-aminocyclopropane-1-carboxylate deaminase/D-cysteine desulfhydrase n=1 Tax=Hugenholtzia roseola TaxID=1002 RepID=UPI0004154D63|nr:pyridoxal-phosphate dependent enzyme [Hugenholtzia roseola]
MLVAWQDSLFEAHRLKVFIFRLDLIDPHLGGNKYFKLLYNLEEAKQAGKKTLLTFGGAYSNHLRATAAAGQVFDFQTVGVVRGRELAEKPLNSVLDFCVQAGMKLHFVERQAYRQKKQEDWIANLKKEVAEQWGQSFSDFFLLPEGGSNAAALKGCAQIPNLIKEKLQADFQITAPDFILTPVGTAGTAAGLFVGKEPQTKIIGVSALKGGAFLYQDARQLLEAFEKKYATFQFEEASFERDFSLWLDYHFGGYAQKKPALMQFIAKMETQMGLSLEPTYSGKLFFAFYDQIVGGQNPFPRHSTIVLLHTGGLWEKK